MSRAYENSTLFYFYIQYIQTENVTLELRQPGIEFQQRHVIYAICHIT